MTTSGCIAHVYFCSSSLAPARARDRAHDQTAGRSPWWSWPAQLRSRLEPRFLFSFLSGCRAGASPASCTKRQPERLPYKQNAFACVPKRRLAGREREGSAARSAQQTNARLAAPCRATAVRACRGNVASSLQSSKGKWISEKSPSLRVQLLATVGTTARRTLQHSTCDDCSFCFSGLE